MHVITTSCGIVPNSLLCIHYQNFLWHNSQPRSVQLFSNSLRNYAGRHNMHFLNLEQPLQAKYLWGKCPQHLNRLQLGWETWLWWWWSHHRWIILSTFCPRALFSSAILVFVPWAGQVTSIEHLAINWCKLQTRKRILHQDTGLDSIAFLLSLTDRIRNKSR